MSFGRAEQLKALQDIIQEISKEIMWVNDREEQELVFDWGDKNIDQYIPRKQENYSVSGCQISVATETFQKFSSRRSKVVFRQFFFCFGIKFFWGESIQEEVNATFDLECITVKNLVLDLKQIFK